MKKLKAVFFGTPDFSVPTLEILANHPKIEIVKVISMPDRKQGRGMESKSPEVIQYAKDNRLPFFQTANINKDEEILNELDSAKIDLFIVLAFAQFLNSKLLKIPTIGSFNIHTSLLPKYRGAAPIQFAILNGDKETGVSIQKMVKQMDAGDIAYSQKVQISDDETGGQLYTRLKFTAALCMNDFISEILENNVSYTPQDESLVSFAPVLSRDSGALDFTQLDIIKAKNKIRGLYPWPGTYCFLNGKRLKVFQSESSEYKLKPGELSTDNNQLIVGCLDGSLRLSSVQLEGKKKTTDSELLNGMKGEVVLSPTKDRS